MRLKRPPRDIVFGGEIVSTQNVKALVERSLNGSDEPHHEETGVFTETSEGAATDNGHKPGYTVNRGNFGVIILKAVVTPQQLMESVWHLRRSAVLRMRARAIRKLSNVIVTTGVTAEVLQEHPELQKFKNDPLKASSILDRKAEREDREADTSWKLSEKLRHSAWIRVISPPAEIHSVGQWGKTGQGGGASGGKGKPKKGSGHPAPHPGYKMPENFLKGFGFGQPQLDGVQIIGGGHLVGKNKRLESLRRQVLLQIGAAARHKKEVTRLLQEALVAGRENAQAAARLKLKEEAIKIEQKEKDAAYQADRLEMKIHLILSGKRRKTSAKTAKTKSDRKNAKKNKKGNQQGKKREED